MKRWKVAEHDADAATQLAAELKVPRAIAATLVGRGYDSPEELTAFLHPRLQDLSDPFVLPAMQEAVQRIWEAIDQEQRVVVYGDYDVDGISSTALLVRVLKKLGADVSAFLPRRLDEGYGLSADGIERCIEEANPQLIVTVDCGTSSADEVRATHERGIDVIVTDHHEPGAEVAPAVAVVNPKLGNDEGLQTLAGVGVAFKLCHALIKAGRDAGRDVADRTDLRDYMAYVSLGTITDIVPLLGENRILVKHGLAQLNVTKDCGLVALKRVADIKKDIAAYHVGFVLGPRLNAAGRVGDVLDALELLLTDDATRADVIARHLDQVNRERQEIEAKIVDAADREIRSYFKAGTTRGIVVAGQGWHPGVVGIVASRMVERFYRPAVVIGIDDEGKGKGSCRSIDGFSLVDALDACGDLLVKYGGHVMAAGVEIEEGQISEFAKRFDAVAREKIEEEDLIASVRIDAWIELEEADAALCHALESLGPFGFRNPRPIWACRGLRVVGEPRNVGKNHLKLRLGRGPIQIDAIGFGMAEREIPEGPIDVAFNLQINEFRGQRTIQLSLKDFRPSEAT